MQLISSHTEQVQERTPPSWLLVSKLRYAEYLLRTARSTCSSQHPPMVSTILLPHVRDKYTEEYGLSGKTSDKESACQCRRLKRPGSDYWVGNIPWRRAWQPTPVFLPGKPRGLQSSQSQTRLKQLSTHTH